MPPSASLAAGTPVPSAGPSGRTLVPDFSSCGTLCILGGGSGGGGSGGTNGAAGVVGSQGDALLVERALAAQLSQLPAAVYPSGLAHMASKPVMLCVMLCEHCRAPLVRMNV